MGIRLTFLLPFLVTLFTLFQLEFGYCYELISIMGISQDQKNFYIGRGKYGPIDEELELGMEGTFTNDQVSIVAKVIEISDHYSKWVVSGPDVIVPFVKDQIVTFNYALEKVWMLDPNNYSMYKLGLENDRLEKERLDSIGKRESFKNMATLKNFIDRGVETSISEAKSQEITGREGNDIEVTYNRYFGYGFYGGSGVRYQTEITRSAAIDVPTTRFFLLFTLKYFYAPFKDAPNLYTFLGTNYGIGVTRTKLSYDIITGYGQIFPAFSGGIEYYINGGYALNLEGGFETISTREQFADGEVQDTNEVNYRAGVGISLFF